jgi:MYXO-CTERM domain-containing protein
VYATYLGGNATDQATGVAVDGSGSAYVVGWTSSTTFPTASALQGSLASTFPDAFVAKLNAEGSALVYSTYLGGNDSDQAYGVAVDGNGSAYVVGYTGSTNFPTANALQPSSGIAPDAFVAKLNAGGSALVYATYLGGNASDQATAVAVDGSGNAYVVGWTSSGDFPTSNAVQNTRGGDIYDAFVAKLDAAGSALVYGTYLGGGHNDVANGVAVDASGSVYVVGSTNSANFPTVNALQTTTGGGSDGFVSKVAHLPVGASCSSTGSCRSGFCVDDVCCETACTGGCDRCDLPGTVGTCTVAPIGSLGGSPACTPPFVCDGVSSSCPTACTTDAQCTSAHYCAPEGTCQPRKARGTACNMQAECKAPGCRDCATGNCVDGVCCDTACQRDGKCEEGCTASCATTADCATDGWCNGGVCENKKVPGDACAKAESCSSGFCADGFCCDRSCDGQCEACDVNKGSCTNVSGAPHGSRSACATGLVCAAGSTNCVPPAAAPPPAPVATAHCTSAGDCAPPAPQDGAGCSCVAAPRTRSSVQFAWMAIGLGVAALGRRRLRHGALTNGSPRSYRL